MSQQGKVTRNTGIELLRALCMLAVVFRHTSGWLSFPSFVPRMLGWGVVGFAFISGYYGIKFRPSKLISLWALAAFAVALPFALSKTCGVADCNYLDLLLGNWYLNAYTVLMLFAPLVNKAIENMGDDWKLLAVPLLCAMSLSWASEIPYLKCYVPHIDGFGKHSFFALCYIYVAARIYRELGWFLSARMGMVVIGLLCLCLLPVFGSYTSVVPLLFVMVVFRLFERMRIPHGIERLVMLVVPSLFAIFLLHSNCVGMFAVRWIAGSIPYRGCGWLLASFVIFLACFALDVIRRVVLLFFREQIKWGLSEVDSAYDVMLQGIRV